MQQQQQTSSAPGVRPGPVRARPALPPPPKPRRRERGLIRAAGLALRCSALLSTAIDSRMQRKQRRQHVCANGVCTMHGGWLYAAMQQATRCALHAVHCTQNPGRKNKRRAPTCTGPLRREGRGGGGGGVHGTAAVALADAPPFGARARACIMHHAMKRTPKRHIARLPPSNARTRTRTTPSLQNPIDNAFRHAETWRTPNTERRC
jgi:hypothetical protein